MSKVVQKQQTEKQIQTVIFSINLFSVFLPLIPMLLNLHRSFPRSLYLELVILRYQLVVDPSMLGATLAPIIAKYFSTNLPPPNCNLGGLR